MHKEETTYVTSEVERCDILWRIWMDKRVAQVMDPLRTELTPYRHIIMTGV